MSDEIKLERGRYPWDVGGRYQPPSPRPGGAPTLPPGWGNAPHEEGMMDMPDSPPPDPPTPPPSDRMTAREFISHQEVLGPLQMIVPSPPKERINLDSGRASYMGYEFDLSPDSIESIKIILAMEVCLILERERERVLNTVQQPQVRGGGADGRQNVPEMSGPPEPMEPEVPEGTREVQ